MRKTDINNYSGDRGGSSVSVGSVIKEFFAIIGKILATAFLVTLFTGLVVGVSLLLYVVGIANEPNTINLDDLRLNETSHVYVLNEKKEWEDYRQLYSTENRVWVSYKDIPKRMIDAQVAIEDKRFYDHEGVDWYRTGGAVFSLATGRDEFGGSTITQQLIKNITDDNEVSITRKLREIFRAIKLEKEYTKDDVLEAYLNIVNYGSGCRGVQSAARLYFNKNIQDCSFAECAAIAGITQNPYAFDPLNFPENNRKRREIVLREMYDQEMMSAEEYYQALKESEDMKFVGYEIDDDEDESDSWNWYDDRLFRDVSKNLADALRIDVGEAEDMIYSKGLKIYSAMDKRAQEIAEKKVLQWKTPDDPTMDVGYIMMDFEGRVLATVGGRQERDGRLLWDNASRSSLQPGSTIKPLTSYMLALEQKKINYSTLVNDEPVWDWSYSESGNPIAGPQNWYGTYYGPITATRALNISSNGAAVSVLKMVGLPESYDFLTQKLNFKHLDPDNDRENLSGLSLGGFTGGATVEEMTASYAIFCNQGYYYEPYTYYWVEDREGNVLLDNRDRGMPDRIISAETATIMNRMLSDVVNSGEEALGNRCVINGWDIIGKTGTTDSSYDNWFVGASPYAVAGIWTGHSTPSTIVESEQSKVHYLWRDIMAEWLKGKEQKTYSLSAAVEQHYFNKITGELLTYNAGDLMWVGYYTADNLPNYAKIPTKPAETSTSH
ncbi:MAG TPA: transglycosylase, partial [Ruminococcaceae bacterium]|nr:transglycosylase [Oscillospiraceae bacterium]